MDPWLEKDDGQENVEGDNVENETTLSPHKSIPKYEPVFHLGQIIDNTLPYEQDIEYWEPNSELEYPSIDTYSLVPTMLIVIVSFKFLVELESLYQNQINGDITEEYDAVYNENEKLKNLKVKDSMEDTSLNCKIYLFNRSLNCKSIVRSIFLILLFLYLYTNPFLLLFVLMYIVLF